MPNSKLYIPYSDSIEVTQPDEQEISQKIVDFMARVNRLMYEKYRHAIRDAHAKSHAILKGQLKVFNCVNFKVLGRKKFMYLIVGIQDLTGAGLEP